MQYTLKTKKSTVVIKQLAFLIFPDIKIEGIASVF